MASLNALLDFLKSASLLPGCKPGFARVLQVSHSFLSSTNVSIIHHSNNHNNHNNHKNDKNQDKTTTKNPIILRYHGKYQQQQHQQQNDTSLFSMGMLFAILDEMTTNVIFLHKGTRPTAPGASIHIRLELAGSAQQQQQYQRRLRHNNNNNNNDCYQEFVMDSSVIKSGKAICFTDCKIYANDATDTDRQHLIAYGSQVKYLPSGSWFTDTLFSSPLIWNLYVQAYVRRTDPPPSFPKHVGSVYEYLIPESSSQSIGRAIFRVTPYLTNPFGALHGGAQGMMMEIVGASLAKAILKTDLVELVSIQVDFQSSGRDLVEVTAQEMDVYGDTAQLVVRLVATKTGRIISTGNLRFVKSLSSSLMADNNGPIISRL